MWFFFIWSLSLQLCFCSNPSNSASDFACIMWGLSTKGQNPDVSYPHENKEQEWMAIAINICFHHFVSVRLCWVQELPSLCTSEQHWLMAVPQCAQVWQRKPRKVTLEGKSYSKPNVCHSQMKLKASCPRQRGRNKWKSKHICNYRGM